MEFTKGFNVNERFIPEGATVEVILTNGEIIQGTLYKPAKKEFRVVQPDLTRVLALDEVESLKQL